MKTLEQWLESTDEDDDEDDAMPVPVRSQNASPGDHQSVTVTADSVNGSNPPLSYRDGNSSPLPTVTPPASPVASPPGFQAVEIMVVDRGTQTVSTVGVQTDPLPPPPPGSGFNYQQNVYFGNAAGTDYFSQRQGGYGLDGRPYRQLMADAEESYGAGAKQLKIQLAALQNNIDMLISRYNLPPPPHC